MQRYLVCPSLLAADKTKLEEQIKEIEKSKATSVHFDVMDGKFVKPTAFSIEELRALRKMTFLFIDVHLMIEHPEKYFYDYIAAGADLITFHYEAMRSKNACKKLIKKIHSYGVKVGIAISPNTRCNEIVDFLKDIDLVLVMTVEPGYGGQKYINACTEKISFFRNEINKLGKRVYLEVDGGINKETSKIALDAGASVIVAGSYVFKGDIVENIESL